MQETTVSTTAGLIGMAKGTAIGAAVGTILGPVGSAIGGFIGGSIGYMTGSTAGEKIVKGTRKLQKKGTEIWQGIAKRVEEKKDNIKKAIGNTVARVLNWFA